MAIFDFVLTSANVSSVVRVSRRSLALWSPQQRTIIENVYNAQSPKIITLECRGSVFFGSSMQMLSHILEEAGINASVEEKAEISIVNSPLPHRHSRVNSVRIPSPLSPASISPGSGQLERRNNERGNTTPERRNLLTPPPLVPPRFIVLDLKSVTNVDASAARGCFLQLAKMCQARKIVVCAAGTNSRISWMLETHDTAEPFCEALSNGTIESNEKIILFGELDEGEIRQSCDTS